MAPKDPPGIVAGTDARKVIADHRIAVKELNNRLTASREWYEDLRKDNEE